MKSLYSILFFIFLLTTFNYSCCKKNELDTTCGCNAIDTKYSLQDITGRLRFHQYNMKWVLTYSPAQGAISNFFPCNTNQDSLQAILQGANQNQVFQVKFSGKVKTICPGEDFGTTIGLVTFDYIIIDSLKRN